MSVFRKCERCGANFTVPYPSTRKRFCSNECRYTYVGKQLQDPKSHKVYECEICHVPIRAKARSHKPRFCSRKCKAKWQSTLRGPLNPNWKPSSDIVPSAPRSVRNHALHENGNRCQSCQATENLQVHHLDENRENNDPSNLIILCCSCHAKWHAEHGRPELSALIQSHPQTTHVRKPPPIRICAVCNQEFQTYKRRMTCSPQCEHELRSIKAKARPHPKLRRLRTCEICNEQYIAKKKKQRFCSRNCQIKHLQNRRRAKARQCGSLDQKHPSILPEH